MTKDIVIHIDILLRAAEEKALAADIDAIVTKAAARRIGVWIYAGHAPLLLDESAGSDQFCGFVQGLRAKGVQWLAALGKDGDALLATHSRLEQVLVAADRLAGEFRIVSEEPTTAGLGADCCLSPRKLLDEMARQPAPSMPFIDLGAQQDVIRQQLESNVLRVIREGRYILGPEIKEAEKRLAAFADSRHALTCASGTDALLMALMAYGIGPGDVIFTTTFTFIATAEVITLLGARPVFVDIDGSTFNLDPELLEAAIIAVKNEGHYTPRGIIPVDLFGLPADYDRILEVAAKYQLFVIEDAAQGFGGLYHGRRAGNLGHIGATSFFPAKPLGCYGDGGAVFTNDDQLAAVMESIRVHGKGQDKYDNVRVGLNARMDTLQAAILLPKLELFPAELEARQRVAARYSAGLGALRQSLTLPHIPAGYQSAWAQYSLVVDNRQAVMAELKHCGIPTMIYYPKPLHLQTAYHSLGYKKGDLPMAETVSEKIFSLPMHPYLRDEEIDRIIEAVAGAVVKVEGGGT